MNKNSWVRWVDPIHVYSTQELSRVSEMLDLVEHQTELGHYAIGFVSYEAGAAFDDHFIVHNTPARTPLVWFAICDKFEPHEFTIDSLPEFKWTPHLNERAYADAIRRIKEHISRGETYQVNFTFPLISHQPLDIRNLFLKLSQSQTTPYSMLIDTPDFAVASASPELFFRLNQDHIECRPMKGTCPRAPHPSMDQSRGSELQHSIKNRAENLMIVDMVRNDLGRIAEPGTIAVDQLFEVSPWPTLWQMTSTISARTRCSLREVFSGLFPSASITGAPKLQTSAIIAGLEKQPRGLYTGAIGIIGPGRNATFSVAIRTAIQNKTDGTTRYGIGSGIVWDSEASSEYAECLLKAKVITAETSDTYELLETMRWHPVDGFTLAELHLHRMKQSADYLGYPWPESAIREAMENITAPVGSENAFMVRLLLDKKGRVRTELKPLLQPAFHDHPERAPVVKARIDSIRLTVDSLYLYHKTTNRQVYEEAKHRFPDVDEVLLVNNRDELMEFTNGNVAVFRNGNFITPPIESGLLPGTFRKHLIDTGLLHESVIPLSSIHPRDEIYFINSVRGWRRIMLLPSAI